MKRMQEQPNAARIYDYYLGGHPNTLVDREAAQMTYNIAPVVRFAARANRQVVQRFTKHLCSVGIEQFLDLGSGLPTMGNTHEVVLSVNENGRVAYIDHDSTVVDYSQRILEDADLLDKVISVEADLREIETVFKLDDVINHLDFTQPVGVLLSSVLHFVTDDELLTSVINYIHKNIAAGSYVALTHGISDLDIQAARELTKIYAVSTTPLKVRSKAEVESLLRKFELVPPGFVDAPEWRPDPDQPPIGGIYKEYGIHSGMGKKV